MTFSMSDSNFLLLLNIIFFLLLTCNIIFVHFRTSIYERPLIFFILISFMFGIIAIEIIFYNLNKRHVYLILFQIIVLSLILLGSQLLIFPSIIGMDPWGHQRLTMMILDNGFIPDDFSYSKLPLMHLEIGSTSLITGLNYKLATMLSISLLQILCGVLFVFLLGKAIFNVKVGLLAGLLLVIGNSFIGNSLEVTPTTIAAILMLIIIYLLFIFRKKNYLTGIFLTIFFMISLIFTHTITSMCMAIILFVSYLIVKIFNKIYNKKMEMSITTNIVAFFLVAMFSWWIYASGHIKVLADIIKVGFNEEIFVHAPSKVIGYIATTPIFEQFFNQFGIFLFFSISLIGCFYMISLEYGNHSTFKIAVVGLTPLIVGFSSLIFGYFIIPERWWYFSQILLAIPIAIAFLLLCTRFLNKSLKPIFILFLTVFISFVMVMSPNANLDNHIFSPNTGVRSALTETEMTTAAFFVEKSIGNLSSDFDYFTNPSSSILINYYGLNYDRIKSLDASLLKGEFFKNGNILVIRNEIVKRPFRLFGQVYKLNYDPVKSLDIKGFSEIYDCTSVKGFL